MKQNFNTQCINISQHSFVSMFSLTWTRPGFFDLNFPFWRDLKPSMKIKDHGVILIHFSWFIELIELKAVYFNGNVAIEKLNNTTEKIPNMYVLVLITDQYFSSKLTPLLLLIFVTTQMNSEGILWLNEYLPLPEELFESKSHSSEIKKNGKTLKFVLMYLQQWALKE